MSTPAQDGPGVKATLTPHPSRRRARRSGSTYRETNDVAEATGRLIVAIGRRVAEEDPEDLASLVALDSKLREAWATAIDGLRASGYSDARIGDALGTTRQAVHQRWPRSDGAA